MTGLAGRAAAAALALLLGAFRCGDRDCETLEIACVEVCEDTAVFLQCASCPQGSVDVALCPGDSDPPSPNGCAAEQPCDLDCPGGETCVCGVDGSTPARCVPASCRDPDDCPFGLRCELAFDGPRAAPEPLALRCRTPEDHCVDAADCPEGARCTAPGPAGAPWSCQVPRPGGGD